MTDDAPAPAPVVAVGALHVVAGVALVDLALARGCLLLPVEGDRVLGVLDVVDLFFLLLVAVLSYVFGRGLWFRRRSTCLALTGCSLGGMVLMVALHDRALPLCWPIVSVGVCLELGKRVVRWVVPA